MRSPLFLAGATLATLLSTVTVAGAVLEVWWWCAVGASGLLSATFLAALDGGRRVHGVQASLRSVAATAEAARTEAAQARRDSAATAPLPAVPPPTPPSTPPPSSDVTQDDLVGTVRLLQAQYTGRLDRLQSQLDRALERLEHLDEPR